MLVVRSYFSPVSEPLSRIVFGAECLMVMFQATCFVHIVAMIMTAIMIYHIRSKYTAVGASPSRHDCNC
jgi:hypothetical protein